MKNVTLIDWAAVCCAVVVVGALLLVGLPRETPLRPIDSVTADQRLPQAPVSTAPIALFIGDSYTSGNGSADMSYACVAARQMNWICKLGAEPGTGYISGGNANRTFGQYTGPSTSIVERIPRLALMYRPDVVVLDGGRNDTFAPAERVLNAMQSAVASIRRAWPSAQLVFIRPRHMNRPADDLGYGDAFLQSLREADAPNNMTIIDPVVLLAGQDTTPLLKPDGEHPDDEGAVVLAAALLTTLYSSGLAVGV